MHSITISSKLKLAYNTVWIPQKQYNNRFTFILILNILCAQAFSLQLLAQQKVLVEKFSNPNCNPCRVFDRKFDTLRVLYADKIDVIEYTTSFPSPIGYFKLNVSDNTDRQRYYRLGAVPMLCINGSITGTPDFTEELINKELLSSKSSQMNLSVFIQKDTLTIQGTVRYEQKNTDSVCVRVIVAGSKNKNQMEQIAGKHTGFIMQHGEVSIRLTEVLKNPEVFKAQDAFIVVLIQDERSKRILSHRVITPQVIP